MTAIGQRLETKLGALAAVRFLLPPMVLSNRFFSALRYSDIPGLERSINDAYRVASERLLNVFLEKFRLLDHLNALKHYLMLGYGDFADQLMEALGYEPFEISMSRRFTA
jgi:hypothetical protein